MGALLACIAMHHVYAWYPQRTEEISRSGTGVRDGCELSLGTENEPNSFRKASSVLNHLLTCHFSEFFLLLSERTFKAGAHEELSLCW